MLILISFISEWGKTKEESHRIFFDELAASKGFHPTQEPYGWYDVTYNDVLHREVIITWKEEKKRNKEKEREKKGKKKKERKGKKKKREKGDNKCSQ